MRNIWVNRRRHKDAVAFLSVNCNNFLDFEAIIGDTVKEKFEGIYLAIYNLARQVNYDIAEVRMSPEMASSFEICSGMYSPDPVGFLPPPVKVYWGSSFEIWKYYDMPIDLIMVEGNDRCWHGIKVTNFIY